MSRDHRLTPRPMPASSDVPSDTSSSDGIAQVGGTFADASGEGWLQQQELRPRLLPTLAVSNPSGGTPTAQRGRRRFSTGTFAPNETVPWEGDFATAPSETARPRSDSSRLRTALKMSINGLLATAFGSFFSGMAVTIAIEHLVAPHVDVVTDPVAATTDSTTPVQAGAVPEGAHAATATSAAAPAAPAGAAARARGAAAVAGLPSRARAPAPSDLAASVAGGGPAPVAAPAGAPPRASAAKGNVVAERNAAAAPATRQQTASDEVAPAETTPAPTTAKRTKAPPNAAAESWPDPFSE